MPGPEGGMPGAGGIPGPGGGATGPGDGNPMGPPTAGAMGLGPPGAPGGGGPPGGPPGTAAMDDTQCKGHEGWMFHTCCRLIHASRPFLQAHGAIAVMH